MHDAKIIKDRVHTKMIRVLFRLESLKFNQLFNQLIQLYTHGGS